MPFKPYYLHYLFSPENMSTSNKFVLNWTGAALNPHIRNGESRKKVGKTEQ